MEENSIRFEDIPNAITGVLKKLSSLEDKIDGIYELVQSEKEETLISDQRASPIILQQWQTCKHCASRKEEALYGDY